MIIDLSKFTAKFLSNKMFYALKLFMLTVLLFRLEILLHFISSNKKLNGKFRNIAVNKKNENDIIKLSK